MLTVRHLERDWNAGSFRRLMTDLLAARGELSPRLLTDLAKPVPTAAMVLIRLDELGQAHTPLFGKLLRMILANQHADGGWSDAASTAIVLRALRLGSGAGPAIDRGLAYLATLQKDDGLWPAEPLRRLPGDTHVTAWVLFNLGADPSFRRTVQYDDAMAALTLLEDTFAPETRKLWTRLHRRRPTTLRAPVETIWS